jgi:hypothetical protein
MQPMQPMQAQQAQIPVQATNNGFQFTVTPQNLQSAFSAASSVMNNLNKFNIGGPVPGGKAEPPNRPAPVPTNGANPMVPQ